jgi:uncharacterized protein (DUF952 family)
VLTLNLFQTARIRSDRDLIVAVTLATLGWLHSRGMTRIYHIATAADWAQAQRDGQYTTSARGITLAEEGFIHASQAAQVARVANAFFQGAPELVLLIIDTERVGPEIRYEPVPGQDLPYPHIYGPLNPDAVVETRPFVPGPDGTFTFP